MQLLFRNDIGPTYTLNSRKESPFWEPTYIDVNEDGKYSRIIDGERHYSFLNNRIEEIPSVDIGKPSQLMGCPLVMDETGRILEYGRDLIALSWISGIVIESNEGVFKYNYLPKVEPDTIQFFKDKVLLTLKARQMVVLVDSRGEIITQVGIDRIRGEGNQLNVPMFSIYISESKTILISDAINSRVIEVNLDGEVIWKYGHDSQFGSVEGFLWKPTCARRLKNGVTVIVDSKNRRIIKVDKNKKIVSELGGTNVEKHFLAYPRSVHELPSGNWIITNTHKNSILEVNPKSKKIVRIIDNSSKDFNFFWPRCTIYDTETNELIVADGKNNRILFLDYLTLNVTHEISSYIDNELIHPILDPHDIQISPGTKNLLITSSGSHEVIEINRAGKLNRRWIGLNDPHSAKYFLDGLVVANTEDNQIVIYYQNKIDTIKSFELKGVISSFHRPRYAIPFKKGFLVLDTDNQRVLYLFRQNNIWCAENIPIIFSPHHNEMDFLSFARWLTITSDGQMIITDTENCRVIICDIY